MVNPCVSNRTRYRKYPFQLTPSLYCFCQNHFLLNSGVTRNRRLSRNIWWKRESKQYVVKLLEECFYHESALWCGLLVFLFSYPRETEVSMLLSKYPRTWRETFENVGGQRKRSAYWSNAISVADRTYKAVKIVYIDASSCPCKSFKATFWIHDKFSFEFNFS